MKKLMSALLLTCPLIATSAFADKASVNGLAASRMHVVSSIERPSEIETQGLRRLYVYGFNHTSWGATASGQPHECLLFELFDIRSTSLSNKSLLSHFKSIRFSLFNGQNLYR